MLQSRLKANKKAPKQKNTAPKSIRRITKRSITTKSKSSTLHNTQHNVQSTIMTPMTFSTTTTTRSINTSSLQYSQLSSTLSISPSYTNQSFTSTTIINPTFQKSIHTPSHKLSKLSLTQQQRSMATFRKIGSVERTTITAEQVEQEKQAKLQQEQPRTKKIPSLNDLMRQLYKKIHPDLMMNYPEQKDQNEKSLGTLQNFLSQLKTSDGNEKYPMLRNTSLPFYLRTPTPGHFQRVELFLHTDATLNRKGIEKQLCTFFKSINLSSTFTWDEEYFPLKGKPSFNKEREDEEAEKEAGESGSAGGNGSETYEQFMERIKREGKEAAKNEQKM